MSRSSSAPSTSSTTILPTKDKLGSTGSAAYAQQWAGPDGCHPDASVENDCFDWSGAATLVVGAIPFQMLFFTGFTYVAFLSLFQGKLTSR